MVSLLFFLLLEGCCCGLLLLRGHRAWTSWRRALHSTWQWAVGTSGLRSEVGARGRAPQAPRAFQSLLQEQKTWARQTKGPPTGLCGKRVGADRDGTGPSTLERPSRLAASLLKVGGWRLGLASFGCGKRPLAPSSTGLLGPASVVYGALGLLGWAGAWQGWSTVSLAARVGWFGLNEVSASSCLLPRLLF